MSCAAKIATLSPISMLTYATGTLGASERLRAMKLGRCVASPAMARKS
ncbi:MAG: hypothetical protein QMC85_04720 [Methanocellales archaeon]|nr:hypothetical protein [Methanocellales archaeon]MDI6903198.1 hypothetical protein [Methanocellales archaeon]